MSLQDAIVLLSQTVFAIYQLVLMFVPGFNKELAILIGFQVLVLLISIAKLTNKLPT